MDFARQTQQLSNLGPDSGQRVPAPKDVRGTTIMPSKAPDTTSLIQVQCVYENGKGTRPTNRTTTKI